MNKLQPLLSYLFLVTPRGLAARLTADPMTRRRDRAAASYWTMLDGGR